MDNLSVNNKKHVLFMMYFITAVSYSIFVIFQMKLITALEGDSIPQHLIIPTVLSLCLHIGFAVVEASYQETVFYLISNRTKTELARRYLSQPSSRQKETGEEEHITFFSDKMPSALLQYDYLSLYLQKQILFFLISAATLLYLSWLCFAAVSVVMCFSGYINKLLVPLLQKKQGDYQQSAGALSNFVVEAHQGFHEIHLQEMTDWAENRFSQMNREAENRKYAYARVMNLSETITVSQNMLIYISILLIGTFLAIRGMAGIGLFLSCAELSIVMVNNWGSIQSLYVKKESGRMLRKELDNKYLFPNDEMKERVSHDNAEWCEASASDDIVLQIRHASFGYKESRRLWSGLSLTIKEGEKVLLTGRSGIGKSTLLQIINGIYKLSEGAVIHTEHVVYVPQTPFLFHGTLRENLVFDRDVEDSLITSVIHRLGLFLPLDAQIEENGDNLSGGERARVSLARALLYNPKLLLLDEVTSQLNEELAKEIERMLLQEYPGTAMLFVSHKSYFQDLYQQVVDIGVYAE